MLQNHKIWGRIMALVLALGIFSGYEAMPQQKKGLVNEWVGYYEKMLVASSNPYDKARRLNDAETRLTYLIYDGLLLRQVQENVVSSLGITEILDLYIPNLAQAYNRVVRYDVETYYFILRDGLKWSNGQPVKVYDIQQFYIALREHDRKRVFFEDFITPDKVDPADAFDYPLSDEEQSRCFGIRFPYKTGSRESHISLFTWPVLPPEAFTNSWTHDKPVGTGRYKVKNAKLDPTYSQIELEKNPDHPLFDFIDRASPERNNIDRIKIFCLPEVDPGDLVKKFSRRMNYNLMFQPHRYIRLELDRLPEENYKFYRFDTNNCHGLVFNCDRPYLQDPRVRKALNMFCGRESMMDPRRPELYEIRHVPTGITLPPQIKAKLGKGYFELPETLNLLQEAGYDLQQIDGTVRLCNTATGQPLPTLRLIVVAEEFDILAKIDTHVRHSFEKIGISCEIISKSMKQMLEYLSEPQAMLNENWDAFYWSFSTVGLPMFEELDLQAYGNYPGKYDPVLTKELENLRTKPGAKDYLKALEKILLYCLDNPPMIVLGKYQSEVYTDPRLVVPDNFRNGRINLFANVHEWYYRVGE
jgi:ABC-type oligopeptide transport system substrate-binding subunit